jgi:L-serine/L-threonine ammonia-lyase
MSAAAGLPVYLKMEALQPVGSFKARGMGVACRASHEAGYSEVVCASGGNAGFAVAYAGRLLGLQVTIVVPESTPARAKDLIRDEGAELIVHGTSWDDAHNYAVDLASRKKAAYIHPFDDPLVWTGHATMVEEIVSAGIKPGLVVVAVGGGGLLCGLLEGLHAAGWSDVPVIAAETEGAASFAASIKAGQLVTLNKISSLATTLGARRVTPKALEWAKQHDIRSLLVTDREAVDACQRFADDHRVLVEPACGAALATVYCHREIIDEREPVLVIVCGGAGVNRELMDWWDQIA